MTWEISWVEEFIVVELALYASGTDRGAASIASPWGTGRGTLTINEMQDRRTAVSCHFVVHIVVLSQAWLVVRRRGGVQSWRSVIDEAVMGADCPITAAAYQCA